MESSDELRSLRSRLAEHGPAEAAEAGDDDGIDKAWTIDPSGLVWEAFVSAGGRLTSSPSNAAYVAAMLERDAARSNPFVLHRRRTRRHGEITFHRPEARM